MPKLSDLKIDEVSLVRKGANQHARVAITKSIEPGGDVEIFDQEGNPVDPESLEDQDIVFDDQGNAYQYDVRAEADEAEEYEGDEADEDDDQEIDQSRLVGVGKSESFAQRRSTRSGVRANFETEFAKALTDAERDSAIAKALGYMDELELIAKNAQDIAESEREARRDAEFYEVAKTYNLPVRDEDLARVMKAVVDKLDPVDVEVVQKCFQFASEAAIYNEVGNVGGGDNSDVMARISAGVSDQVVKSDFTMEQLLAKSFELDPEAYDAYLAEQSQH